MRIAGTKLPKLKISRAIKESVQDDLKRILIRRKEGPRSIFDIIKEEREKDRIQYTKKKVRLFKKKLEQYRFLGFISEKACRRLIQELDSLFVEEAKK